MTERLKLWRISQSENSDYDTYDSAVVVAPDADAAKLIHPSGYRWDGGEWRYADGDGKPWGHDWTIPDNVTAKYAGDAAPALACGEVVCASFNAG